jgi:SAM-dependent methyltransferase
VAGNTSGRSGEALADVPMPPRELIQRTDLRREDRSDEWLRAFYDRTGAARLRGLERALPDDFDLRGRRVLDFGCGAGRVLRQLYPIAASGEFWGCDTYEPTIAWLEQNLSPPFRFYVNDERPMPHPDEYFDLIFAISVFTHITHEWAAWLLELHRILKPEGLLAATFIGPDSWERSLHRRVDEDELGIAMLRLDQSYAETSGPLVLHSPWWLEAHWGRAFEEVTLWPHGFAWPQPPGEGGWGARGAASRGEPWPRGLRRAEAGRLARELGSPPAGAERSARSRGGETAGADLRRRSRRRLRG